jgi:hypothetical protein
MFRLDFEKVGTSSTVRIQGRFVGHFAADAKLLIARRRIPSTLTVDISEVTFIDSNGEETLTWLSQVGASFVADSSYSSDICERLHLRLANSYVAMSPSYAHTVSA